MIMTGYNSIPPVRAMLYIAVAATAWGTGGAVAAVLYSTSGLDPSAVSFWRFLGGAAALAALRLSVRGPGASSLTRRVRNAPVQLAVTGVGMAVYQTAYFAAVGTVGLAIATVVTLGSGPVLVTLGARRWMAERLGLRGIGIVGSALAGLVLLVLSDFAAGDANARQPLLGIGLALLSAVAYAGTTLLNRAMGTTDADVDPVGNALIGFVVGTVCLLPFALASGVLPRGGDPVLVMSLLGYLGLVPSALAYGLFFSGLTAVTATTASVVALVEPVAAGLIAVTLLGERLTATAVVGGAVLLGSVVALATTERRAPTTAGGEGADLDGLEEPAALKAARSIGEPD
jgi:DME family drug/metabolite transporter